MSDAAPDAAPAEITLRAIVLGVVIGLVMGVANVYLGLTAGMTVSASIPAAVVSMGILRGLFRTGTILENNIVQTIASAGESLAAGIIFTMPALILAGVWSDFDFLITTLVAITGGLLGVLFMIPLRKPMIVEDEDLVYPEGVACAKVLEAGETGGSSLRAVFGAMGVGAVFKLLVDGLGVLKSSLAWNPAALGTRFFTGMTAQPALVGVGYIVGINIAVLVFVGGAISWVVAGPIMAGMGYGGVSVDDPGLVGALKPSLRYMGVGAMVVGGLWSILMIRKGIAQGLRETFGSYKASRHAESPPDRTEIDMERRWIVLLIAATAVAILGLYFHVTGNFGVSALATALMVICSFFFVAVAAYIVGLVGSSNSPVSGMTICSVLITSAFIFLFGFRGDVAILATLGVAGVVCCAACTSGDVCQDLKTGHLVGATPYRQQWVEVLGVVTAAFVMQPILRILHAGYGIGTDAHLAPALQGKALEAPQAQLFASLMEGFFGDGTVPWGLVAIGAGIGIAIVVSDSILRGAGSGFRLHVMPVAVGMYLPFGLVTAILVGGLLSWFAGRGASSEADRRRGMERGVPLASGLIAGEAICGVLIAIPRANKIELPTLLSAQPVLMGGLTVAALVGVALWMIAAARPRSS